MTAHYIADTERLGLGRPDHEPLASEYVEPIVALIADLVERGHAYAVERRRLLPRALAAVLRRAVAPRRSTRWTRARASRAPTARRIRSISRSGRARRRTRTPSWHVAVGPRPPGLAHRVLGDGRGSCSGVELDIHGGGTDLLFPHHENEAAQTLAARGKPLARAVDAQRDARSSATRRCPSRWATSAGSATCSTRSAATRCSCTSVGGHYRQPIAFTRERLDAAAASVARIREAGRRLGAGDSPEDLAPLRDAFFDALADDFNTARALRGAVRLDPRGQPARGPGRRRAPARDARGARARQPARRRRGRRPRSSSRWPSAREGPRAARTSPRPTGCATSCARAGWEVRDGPRRPGARAASGVIVYGRNAVREALRGPRAGAADLGRQGREWSGAPVTHAAPARSPRAAARTPTRACAPTSRSTATPTPPSCSRAPEPLPRRARRGHRPAEPRRGLPDGRGRGATGVVIPERRSAEVTPAVCKASAGAVEHLRDRARPQPRRLPRATPRRRSAGATARRPARARRIGARTTAAASCSCSARRAKGSGRG